MIYQHICTCRFKLSYSKQKTAIQKLRCLTHLAQVAEVCLLKIRTYLAQVRRLMTRLSSVVDVLRAIISSSMTVRRLYLTFSCQSHTVRSCNSISRFSTVHHYQAPYLGAKSKYDWASASDYQIVNNYGKYLAYSAHVACINPLTPTVAIWVQL